MSFRPTDFSIQSSALSSSSTYKRNFIVIVARYEGGTDPHEHLRLLAPKLVAQSMVDLSVIRERDESRADIANNLQSELLVLGPR